MLIDPSKFHPINVADTCSVWNILSSKLLYSTAISAKCSFCITGFVHYECLVKPRKSVNHSEEELKSRLSREQKNGQFIAHSSDIGDLQSIRLLESRKRLGKGELSSIAFSMKIGHAFITDDMKARKLSTEAGNALTQTTPHLLAWLNFNSLLGDSDNVTIINQHNEMERPLEHHLKVACTYALQCRLIK